MAALDQFSDATLSAAEPILRSSGEILGCGLIAQQNHDGQDAFGLQG
jgi:hypothetical protein